MGNEIKPFFDYQKMIYRALFWPNYLNFRPNTMISAPTFPEERERQKMMQEGDFNVYSTNKLKHLWIKKATGLGITEFLLRLMAWLCLKDDNYKNSQMVIVTGPNQELAIKLIKRIKGLVEPLGIYFDTKETVVNLNSCEIAAYPSNHLDSFRSLTEL
jgi:hypothetical protein